VTKKLAALMFAICCGSFGMSQPILSRRHVKADPLNRRPAHERRNRTTARVAKAVTALAGLLLVAILVDGCSSMSASTTSSTGATNAKLDAAFVSKVNQVCAANLKRFPAVGTFPYANFNQNSPNPSQLPAVGAYFAENQRGDGSLESAIQNLDQPATGAGSWNKIKALALAFLNNAAAQKRYAEASDVSGFVSAVHQNETITNQLKSAATEAGLPANGPCAQVF
jgi:hypothetical protein